MKTKDYRTKYIMMLFNFSKVIHIYTYALKELRC